MKISDLLEKKKTTLSFEIFPPKADAPFAPVLDAAKRLSLLNPDYMSVTYGANGGASKNTIAITSMIENGFATTAMAHMTCVSSSADDIKELLEKLRENNVENILALRGDIPEGIDVNAKRDYQYAYQLIKDIKDNGKFCVGGACYPEGHIECSSREADIDNLKMKVDSGCDFLVTQMFFDNEVYYDFLDRAVQKGINVPIIAGIMPAMNAKQIKRSCDLSGSKLPRKFRLLFEKYYDKPNAFLQAGISYAIDQITDLIINDVRGIHVYTMNKADVAKKITESIGELIK